MSLASLILFRYHAFDVREERAKAEHTGMEYEGIYRKTGGSSQSKQITQLFERGDYDAFDLSDVEVFNDISSVTSVLKTYFRQLPNPLLTHELHESFVAASGMSCPLLWFVQLQQSSCVAVACNTEVGAAERTTSLIPIVQPTDS